MSTSKIQLWNMALGFVGTRTIVSEDERCQEAIQCKLFWDIARRQTLQAYPWAFAQRRETLSRTVLSKEYALEWKYAYGLPTLCLKPHSVWGSVDEHREAPFSVVAASDGNGRIILADASPCILSYTVDTERDTTFYDDLFAQTLAYKLASLIVVPLLRNNSSKVQELTQLYLNSLPTAMASNASARKPAKPADTWRLARGASFSRDKR